MNFKNFNEKNCQKYFVWRKTQRKKVTKKTQRRVSETLWIIIFFFSIHLPTETRYCSVQIEATRFRIEQKKNCSKNKNKKEKKKKKKLNIFASLKINITVIICVISRSKIHETKRPKSADTTTERKEDFLAWYQVAIETHYISNGTRSFYRFQFQNIYIIYAQRRTTIFSKKHINFFYRLWPSFDLSGMCGK